MDSITSQWFECSQCAPVNAGFYIVELVNGEKRIANYQYAAFTVFDKSGLKDDRWFTDDSFRVARWKPILIE